uniref:Solute carrier family 26 member 6 n=1 Tax=Terrapene triunguis TaxID=2587831 RepID=A0A674J5S4_9SAUR
MEQSELRRRPWASQADSEVLSEAELEEIAPRTRAPRPSLCSKSPERGKCSCAAAKSLLFRFLPILSWLPRYPVRDWLLGDIVSGFSVGIMHLPQGLAYALLAGVPPVTGLYSSFYPVFLYFLFGTSRHISVGPFAVISVMIGSVTGSLMPDSNFMDPVNGTNETVLNEARRDSARVELVATLTILVGVFQMALGMLQFGFVVTYLSEPLVRGYTTAAAVQVLVSQLKYVFGVEVAEQSGPLSMFAVSRAQLGQVVSGGLHMSAIIVSTGISYGAGLKAKFGISVVGDIPSGMKPPVAPNVSYFGQVVGNAFAIAVVGYAICISLGKIFALKHGYKVNSNQELIALGICNFVGGFFQCFSISCSMSRTLVQETTGGNSQLIWLVTFVATLLLNLDMGLGVSVAFALLTVIFRTQM